jgi:hypothetical protein
MEKVFAVDAEYNDFEPFWVVAMALARLDDELRWHTGAALGALGLPLRAGDLPRFALGASERALREHVAERGEPVETEYRPRRAMLLYWRARIRFRRGDAAGALADLDRYEQLALPDRGGLNAIGPCREVLLLRAAVLEALGRAVEAAPLRKQASGLAPLHGWCHD